MLDLGEGSCVPVATLPAQVLLKSEAHLESAGRRGGIDLEDLHAIVRCYDSVIEDQRRLDVEPLEVLVDGRVEPPDVGAYLLGKDVAELLAGEAFSPLDQLLQSLNDLYGAEMNTLAGALAETAVRDHVQSRFRAFALGLEMLV